MRWGGRFKRVISRKSVHHREPSYQPLSTRSSGCRVVGGCQVTGEILGLNPLWEHQGHYPSYQKQVIHLLPPERLKADEGGEKAKEGGMGEKVNCNTLFLHQGRSVGPRHALNREDDNGSREMGG